jgi:hypothetical protein
MQARGAISQIMENFPQRQTVLATGDRDQHVFIQAQHLRLMDRSLDLPTEVEHEAGPAEAGIVLAQVDLDL